MSKVSRGIPAVELGYLLIALVVGLLPMADSPALTKLVFPIIVVLGIGFWVYALLKETFAVDRVVAVLYLLGMVGFGFLVLNWPGAEYLGHAGTIGILAFAIRVWIFRFAHQRRWLIDIFAAIYVAVVIAVLFFDKDNIASRVLMLPVLLGLVAEEFDRGPGERMPSGVRRVMVFELGRILPAGIAYLAGLF